MAYGCGGSGFTPSPGGFWVGFQAGQGWDHKKAEAQAAAKEAKAEKSEAQVQYLLRLAYPPPIHQHPFNDDYLNKLPPSSVLKDVEQHKTDPGVVRAILFEQIKKDTGAFIEESEGFPKGHPYWTKSFTPILHEYAKRSQELKAWVPGEDGMSLGEKISQ